MYRWQAAKKQQQPTATATNVSIAYYGILRFASAAAARARKISVEFAVGLMCVCVERRSCGVYSMPFDLGKRSRKKGGELFASD